MAAVLGGGAVLAVLGLVSDLPQPPAPYVEAATEPNISPDYRDLVIPPNIAPLNFRIRERGQQYLVRIHTAAGPAVDVFSRTGRIRIPIRPWRALLEGSRGGRIFFDIYVKDTEHG